MEPRERRIHRIIDCRAFGSRRIGHVRFPDHAAVDVTHHVKRRTDDVAVSAIEHRRGDWKALRIQRADDPELAVNRMR